VIDRVSLSDSTSDLKEESRIACSFAPAMSATLFVGVTRFYMRPFFCAGVHTTPVREKGGVRAHRCSNNESTL
jgi:hypothetical protein